MSKKPGNIESDVNRLGIHYSLKYNIDSWEALRAVNDCLSDLVMEIYNNDNENDISRYIEDEIEHRLSREKIERLEEEG